MPSLDSTCNEIGDVNSIVIAPMIGHELADGDSNIVGILQCVNKLDGVITPYDVVSTF